MTPSASIDLLAKAETGGFPRFLGPIETSTPLNAAPYMVPLWRLREGDFMSSRRPFIEKLIAVLDELAIEEIAPQAILIGGSILSEAVNPADLDGVIFYRSERAESLAPMGLRQKLEEWKSRGLDVRLIPADGSPVLLIKIAAYFMSLYTSQRRGRPAPRGPILIDCTDDKLIGYPR